PQCPHALASTSRRCVGFGCNGRCAPGCGFFLRRLFTNSVVFLWPWLGGTLELFGVFGGRSCLACRRATSASRLVTFAIKRSFDSASAKATPSSPSRSSESNAFRFIGSVNHTLILRSMAQVNDAKTLLLNDRFQKTGVSNYYADDGDGPSGSANDHPALDQQILHHGHAAREQLGALLGRPGVYGVHAVLAQPGFLDGRQHHRGL